MNRELTVKGIGKAAAAPDLIVLSMELEVCDYDYEKAMRRSSEMLDSFRAAIASAGHDGKDLKTSGFNINTKYEKYRENGGHKERFAGYECNHSLRLEFGLDVKMLGATLGAIARCEVRPNFNIRFTIKDPNAISERLLESAVENAKWKAEVLAKAADVKLGVIQRIDYNWNDLHLYSKTDYRLGDFMFCEAAAPYAMEIEPEDIDVSDTATVVWAIE